MEWVAIAILGAIMVMGALIFLSFIQSRELARASVDTQTEILEMLQQLGKKIDDLSSGAGNEPD